MKLILNLSLLSLILAVTSCGQNAAKLPDSKSSDSTKSLDNLVTNCSVVRDEDTKTVEISCPDGSLVVVKDGIDGQDGSSCSVADQTGGAMITCGTEQVFIRDGVDGQDGSACKVAPDTAGLGALISCDDGSQAFITNGLDGSDGQDGVDGSDGSDGLDGLDGVDGSDGSDGVDGSDGSDGLDAVMEIVDPCGSQTTHGLDEVLLVLSSGDILAHLDGGNNKQYITKLQKSRSYTTSDGTGCTFSISATGVISWQ